MIADRWGVTEAETGLAFGCDAYVDSPTVVAWRGVSVGADPERVWPWLRQLQVAPYSYDWVDNLGRRSPRHLTVLDDPRPGDPFMGVMGGRPCGETLQVDPPRELTGRIAGAFMSYRVLPLGDGSRLLLKIVAELPRWAAPAVALGDLVMARRQLLNLAELATAQ